MMKNNLRHIFNRAAASYDEHCSVQKAIGRLSIELLLKYQNRFNTIVDFACGTGESTICLTQQVHFNQCYAVDFAEQLLAIAKKKKISRNIIWIHADFNHALFAAGSFDLIFCNLGLQWSDQFSKTLLLWNQYLCAKGMLIFSVPLSENFPEIQAPYKKNFLSHEQIINLLPLSKWDLLESKVESFEVPFQNQMEILRSLKATGTNSNNVSIIHNKGLSPIPFHKIFRDQNIRQLTYKIGTYLVKKTHD